MKLHDSHFAYNKKIFDKIYARNLITWIGISISLLILPKKYDNFVFIRFLAEHRFVPILCHVCVYFEYVQNLEGALILLHHSEVIQRPMVLILVSMEGGDPCNNTFLANIRV